MWRAPWFWSRSLSRLCNDFGLVSRVPDMQEETFPVTWCQASPWADSKSLIILRVSLPLPAPPHTHTHTLTPARPRGRQQPHCANLISFIQIIFLERTFIFRNPGQTTSKIESSKVINNEFREIDDILPDFSQHVCFTTNQKIIFHLRKIKTMTVIVKA